MNCKCRRNYPIREELEPKVFNIKDVENMFKEIKDKINLDKKTLENNGMKKDTKGHSRSIMLIDEYLKELENEIF